MHTLLDLAARTGRHVGPHISLLLSALEAAGQLPSEADAQEELGSWEEEEGSGGEGSAEDVFGFDGAHAAVSASDPLGQGQGGQGACERRAGGAVAARPAATGLHCSPWPCRRQLMLRTCSPAWGPAPPALLAPRQQLRQGPPAVHALAEQQQEQHQQQPPVQAQQQQGRAGFQSVLPARQCQMIVQAATFW
jgi:hypothetical protein